MDIKKEIEKCLSHISFPNREREYLIRDLEDVCKAYALSILPEEKEESEIVETSGSGLHYEREEDLEAVGFNQAIQQAKDNIEEGK